MPKNALIKPTPPPKKRARGDGGGARSGASKTHSFIGKLAGIMGMPMDIFFEIAAHLHPLDMLHLSRASKQLRAALLSRKSRFVWAASLEGVMGLPPCPKEMSEPAYAALIFDRICNLCGERSSWVDYAIRLRLCKPCYKENIVKGESLNIAPSFHMERFYMAITPCETGKDISVAEMLEEPFTHSPERRYYAPQLKAVAALWQRPMVGTEELVKMYVNIFLANSANIHKHATALLRWEADVALQKHNTEDALKARRKASIVEKLEKLGYTEADFPTSKEWTKLVEQPKELTERIWHKLWPKLEPLLQAERARQAQAAYAANLESRLDQISGYYNAVVGVFPPTVRALMPNLFNLHRLPSIDALARKNGAQGPVAEVEFVSAMPQMLQDIIAYLAEAKVAALARMRDRATRTPKSEQWQEDLQAMSPDEALTRHYALFGCNSYSEHPSGMKPDAYRHLTFEEIHAHHREYHPKTEWASYLWCSGEYELGGKMLDATGLPRDTPLAVLTALVRAGRLYCACGDPALPPPEALDWPKLYAHVREDLMRYETRKKEINYVKTYKVLLRPHHALTGPNACIKLLPEGADTTPARRRATVDLQTRLMIEDRLGLRPTPSSLAICRLCKALTARTYWDRYSMREIVLPETHEGIVHHLRGWHNKKFQKRDILFFED